jgi:hypothetical protein
METYTFVNWDDAKGQRGYLLKNCDWTQLSDSPLSEEKLILWRDYRQALRDIPQTYQNIEDIIWPTEPGE